MLRKWLTILSLLGPVSSVGCATTGRSETQAHSKIVTHIIDESEAIEIAKRHLRDDCGLVVEGWSKNRTQFRVEGRAGDLPPDRGEWIVALQKDLEESSADATVYVSDAGKVLMVWFDALSEGCRIGPVRAIEIATEHLREQYELDTQQWHVFSAQFQLDREIGLVHVGEWEILFERAPSQEGEEVAVLLNTAGKIRNTAFREYSNSPKKVKDIAGNIDAVRALGIAKQYDNYDRWYGPKGWTISIRRSGAIGVARAEGEGFTWYSVPASDNDWLVGFSAPFVSCWSGFHSYTVSSDTGEIIPFPSSTFEFFLESSSEATHGQKN